MVSQPPPAIGERVMDRCHFPICCDFIAHLGDPSSISHLSQQWDALGSNMTVKITDPYNSSQPNSTLAGFMNVVYPNWKGSGAEAYSQQFLDLLSHGSQVAARASFTPITRGQADYQPTTFARSTDSAFQALDYVKQQAASVTPMDHQSAYSGYVNSLDGLGQLQVAYAQRSPAGRQLVDQRVSAYAAAADEAKRQQLLTLLAGLDQTYNSVASSLPTKAPGGPPALHDPSIGVPSNGPLPGLGTLAGSGPGAATPGVVPLSTAHGPSAQHLTTQLPAAPAAGQLPSGSLPGSTAVGGLRCRPGPPRWPTCTRWPARHRPECPRAASAACCRTRTRRLSWPDSRRPGSRQGWAMRAGWCRWVHFRRELWAACRAPAPRCPAAWVRSRHCRRPTPWGR